MTVIVTQWEGRAGRCDLDGEPFDHLQFITIAGFCMRDCRSERIRLAD